MNGFWLDLVECGYESSTWVKGHFGLWSVESWVAMKKPWTLKRKPSFRDASLARHLCEVSSWCCKQQKVQVDGGSQIDITVSIHHHRWWGILTLWNDFMYCFILIKFEHVNFITKFNYRQIMSERILDIRSWKKSKNKQHPRIDKERPVEEAISSNSDRSSR